MDQQVKENSIVFTAVINKATTLVDGGWRISFDLPADASLSVAQLSQYRDQVITLVVIPEEVTKNVIRS